MRSGGQRVVEMIGWLAVAVAGVVMIAQVMAWPGFRTIAILQSLTPYLALLMAPLAVVALATHRTWMAVVAAVTGIGGLVLALPILFPPDQPAVADDAVGLRIASLNLLYTNDESNIERVAADLAELDLDVIVFSEYTTGHQRALQQTPLADDFAYRIDRSGLGAGGVAIWSTDPVIVADHPDTTNYSLDLTVDGPDGPVRIIGVHPPTPIMDFGAWRRDLATFGELGRTGDTPTVVVGDFNASFWHPDFRSLLDDGYTDAHIAAGHGLSTSWPTDRWYPPFVRLDHALTTPSLVSTDVEDFEIVGSDHEGFVVTVAPAR